MGGTPSKSGEDGRMSSAVRGREGPRVVPPRAPLSPLPPPPHTGDRENYIAPLLDSFPPPASFLFFRVTGKASAASPTILGAWPR